MQYFTNVYNFYDFFLNINENRYSYLIVFLFIQNCSLKGYESIFYNNYSQTNNDRYAIKIT